MLGVVFLADAGQPSLNSNYLGLREDTSLLSMNGNFKPGSHVKVYLPNLAYIAISHSVSAGLVRPANNSQGWEYDMAISHKKVNDTVYEFDLRKGAKFQDGTEFDADSVLLNIRYFQKKPYTFTSLSDVLDRVEKVDKYKVRFHLKEKYGLFLNDAMWLHFYTKKYLERFGWNGKSTCPNLAAPGPYGLGPFVLTKGFVEGDRKTPVVELKANANYWDPNVPKVERITIFTDLDPVDAVNKVIEKEGDLDLSPIPFSYELPTVLSSFSKLIRSPTTNNYSVHINTINGHAFLKDKEFRNIVNKAIDQEMMLSLSMNGEGEVAQTLASRNLFGVNEALRRSRVTQNNESLSTVNDLKRKLKQYIKENKEPGNENIHFKFLVQESLLHLANDLKFFLEQIGIGLELIVVDNEHEVFNQLFNTQSDQNTIKYDFLIWGNYDWLRHPWQAFFVYKPGSVWSTIKEDEKLDGFTKKLAKLEINEPEFIPLLEEMIKHANYYSYMLLLPTPNKLIAINKEVHYKARMSAFLPLWEIEVSDNHWSVRNGEYPTALKMLVKITNQNFGGIRGQ